MAVSLFLSGCSQVQLGAHVGKQLNSQSKGTFKVGSPYKIDGKWYYPKEKYSHTEVGMASWYGPNFHGKKTANGEVFNKYELTAAHRTLQLPSLVRVTNVRNGKSIVVRVNDRGPFAKDRILDLSERSAELLGFKNDGTTKIKLEVLTEQSKQIAMAAKNGVDTSGTELAYNKGFSEPKPKVQPAALTNVEVSDLAPREMELANVSEVPGTVRAGRFMPDPVVVNTLDKPVSGIAQEIFVQAGSFGNPTNAYNLARKLGSIAEAKVVPVNVNGVNYHRVKLGPFTSMTDAHNALTQTSNAGYGHAIIVVE